MGAHHASLWRREDSMSSVKSLSGESRIETAATSDGASAGGGLALLILVVAIVILRLPTLEFSSINYDESVYALIGSGLKSGLVPYVDLVDRKPIGIFLIYGLAEL